MSNPSTNQIKNKSSVSGTTVTEALNNLLLVQGDGTGDMLKIVYDNNNNGKVDVAEVAEAVPWTGVTSKPATFPPQTHNHAISDVTSLQTTLDGKQASLVSGTNIKTINGSSILGSGDLTVSGGGGGSGDVVGPSSSVDGNFALFNGTTGKLLKDTGVKASDFAAASHTQAISTITGLQTILDGKQTNLVSGTNIKTVNGNSLLGSTDVVVQPTLVSGTNIKTINGSSVLGSGDLTVSGSGATIKAIQRGTISIAGGTSSNTATITSVTTAKTELRFLGGSTYDSAPTTFIPRIVLTNSTTITATIAGPGSVACVVSWELTEYN